MSNYRGRKGSNPKMREEEEVAELLRAAEDDVLLKFSVGSHSARSSDLDEDLLRRFEALKLPSNSSKITSVPPPSTQPRIDKHNDGDDGDEFKKAVGADLSARLSALRNSSTESKQKSQKFEMSGEDDEHNEEEEISKVIQWAIDEARLNPSSSVDDDDEDDEEEEEIGSDQKSKPRK